MAITNIKRETAQESPDLTITRQIDELERISQEERDNTLGDDWFQEVRDFHSLTGRFPASPTFRPRVVVPQLQTLMLNEATDLSDQQPKIFIMKDGKRDRQAEDGFTEHWRQQYFNNKIFLAELWGLYCGTGFIQVGFDPEAKRGQGQVWMEVRDPSTVFPDPGSADPEQWVYVILKDRMYIDEIQRLWPENGYRVHPRNVLGRASAPPDGFDIGLKLPDGPMSISGGIPTIKPSGDGRLTVRHLYIRDYTSMDIPKEDVERIQSQLGALIPAPQRKLRWPNGRWIVECDGIVLADGDNPYPFRSWPIIPYHAMPTLGSFWCPPPVRYTKGLQELAERHLTQNFENAVRTNNMIWFIDERTGLRAEEFGGIPAQVCIINANSPVPECKYPQAMPAHMTQAPQQLLTLQKELQGFTPARAGQQAPGNVGADLNDASIFQSQFLTRMRARMMAESVQRTAELVFWTMRNLKQGTQFISQDSGDVKLTAWPELGPIEDYDVYLDHTSIRPMSAAAMRTLVMGLLKEGHMPLGRALEALEFPDSAEIAAEVKEELQLSALSKLKRPR